MKSIENKLHHRNIKPTAMRMLVLQYLTQQEMNVVRLQRMEWK